MDVRTRRRDPAGGSYDALIVPLPKAERLPPYARALDATLDTGLQSFEGEGLRDEIENSTFQEVHRGLDRPVSRCDHHGQVRPHIESAAGQLLSVQPRHDQVGDQNVGLQAFELLERLLPIHRDVDVIERAVLEHGVQELSDGTFVLRDQKPNLRIHHDSVYTSPLRRPSASRLSRPNFSPPG